ncbi:MAG: hypothetical protein LBP20_09875 [Treponema sp.]|jgi:DNA-binding transcriptional ArsR family regulator|nr:hypothetical protein [Treponema sp.]
MIQFVFFLRFRSQLRRTDHCLVDGLEGRFLDLIRDAGGIEKNERRFIGALFRESTPALGLDILTCVEGILKQIERDIGRLYGYALLIGKDIDDAEAGRLCRLFSSPLDSGLYCDDEVRKILGYYLQFDPPGRNPSGPEAGYARFKAFKVPEGFGSQPSVEAEQARRADIVKKLELGGRKDVLVLGPEFSGKRAGLYEFCAGGAPPLTLRFTAGKGLAAVSDAYSPAIRAFLAEPSPEDQRGPGGVPVFSGELEALWNSLFRDRLHGEAPLFLLRRARRFLVLLIDSYLEVSASRGLRSVLILENIDNAPESAAQVVQEALEPYVVTGPLAPRLEIYGTSSAGENLSPSWDRFFSQVIRMEGEGAGYNPDMSRDLWEISYAFALLGRYFPGILFPQLLAEEGKSPGTISRALAMLTRAGIVDTPQDPRPRIAHFISRAEEILGERKELIRGMVRNRLLDWVFSDRLRPCFALLEALADMGDGAGIFMNIARGDELILQSVVTDMTNGTFAGIGEAVREGRLESVVGPQRAPTVAYLYKILGALLNGNDKDIREAFRDPPGENWIYPPFRAQVLVNTAAYQLGIRDIDAALNTTKTAFILSQQTPWTGLAQSNRLFSLVNLVKQRMEETVDYADFAVDHAEKTANHGELAVASYYAAAVQTLCGNLSRAEQLAVAAENHAVTAGRMEWVDRARFFQGKIAFDLGCYQDALRIFQAITGNPAGNSSVDKLSLLEAWAYRARLYSRNPLLPKPPGGVDTGLFELEGAYLAGDYARTADLAAALMETPPEESLIHTEQPDWHSGFAQCEFLLLPVREFWDRMVSVYRALALCRLSAAGGTEALGIMQRVMRNERFSEMDPFDAFYFYAWYQVLKESGAAQVDMNTAVSKAFKRLQRRASRIDDPRIRQSYLTQPYWNGALSLAAREHKLI